MISTQDCEVGFKATYLDGKMSDFEEKINFEKVGTKITILDIFNGNKIRKSLLDL